MAVLTPDEIAELDANLRIMETGCGPLKRCPGSITLDINPGSQADIVHDLNCFPNPFVDSEFDIVIAEHVLEQLRDNIRVVEELHRIMPLAAHVSSSLDQ